MKNARNQHRTDYAKELIKIVPVSYTHLDVYKRQDILYTAMVR